MAITKLKKLKEIVLEKRYSAVLLISLAIISLLLGLAGSLIVPSTLGINPTAEAGLIAIMLVQALLISLNITVALHNQNKSSATEGKGFAISGTIVALFTSACPVCQPYWLFFLGAGTATAFLADISPYLGIIAIALLSYSLNKALEDKSCGIRRKNTNK